MDVSIFSTKEKLDAANEYAPQKSNISKRIAFCNGIDWAEAQLSPLIESIKKMINNQNILKEIESKITKYFDNDSEE